MSIISALQWRYATKKMNGKKISPKKIDSVLEAIRLAPTSSGLQPFEVLVITSQEVKEKIKKLAYNQTQVSDCSHLLVFAAWDHYTVDRIDRKSTRLNSSHVRISYAVFCLKKKK